MHRSDTEGQGSCSGLSKTFCALSVGWRIRITIASVIDKTRSATAARLF